MRLNWIHAEDYNMETFLFFDRWILRYIFTEQMDYQAGSGNYLLDLGRALSRYPSVFRFCEKRLPEAHVFFQKLRTVSELPCTTKEARQAETAILQALEVFVVYSVPEIMNQLNYIRNWTAQSLYDLVDLEGKLVLDVGSGTGRLAFAAAVKAKRVYASEPCGCLRDYLRDRIALEKIGNVRVVDGEVLSLPYEDDTFDVVLAGHVVGDCFEHEIAELSRVLKNGGWIVCCSGDDEFKRRGPSMKFIAGGFEAFRRETVEGGVVYDYRKQIWKSLSGSSQTL